MLYVMKNLEDQFAKYLADDPVRPHISHASRVDENSEVFVWLDDENVAAITCVSYQVSVPVDESELFQDCVPSTAIFYTIWSYAPGAGRTLLQNAVKHIKQQKSTINRFVTLSPKTEMARKFHLKNGATIFRENDQSVNYEYKL